MKNISHETIDKGIKAALSCGNFKPKYPTSTFYLEYLRVKCFMRRITTQET